LEKTALGWEGALEFRRSSSNRPAPGSRGAESAQLGAELRGVAQRERELGRHEEQPTSRGPHAAQRHRASRLHRGLAAAQARAAKMMTRTPASHRGEVKQAPARALLPVALSSSRSQRTRSTQDIAQRRGGADRLTAETPRPGRGESAPARGKAASATSGTHREAVTSSAKSVTARAAHPAPGQARAHRERP
jgi:hypothetical protein